jgi:hypothetical protein
MNWNQNATVNASLEMFPKKFRKDVMFVHLHIYCTKLLNGFRINLTSDVYTES